MRWCEENRVDYVFGLARNDRLRLLKIGAQIRFTARRVVVSMASGYAWQGLWAHACQALET
jgi:hypothetical protein